MKRLLVPLSLSVMMLTSFGDVSAQVEIGHFAPGVFAIRDFIMPDSGFYGALYSYQYSSTRLNNADGNEISSKTLGPNATLNLDVDVNVGVLAPTFIWVSKWKILGARYGAYIAPAFSNTSVGASLAVNANSGRSTEASQVNVGDLCVQPIWLTWSHPHFDYAFAYAFYAPIGKYTTETVSLPPIGDITTEAADNIGLGFWTHQFQGAASWYPWTDKRMAVAGALSYEIHGKKKNFDITPGQNLTFNWGVSQYLPLKKDLSILLEIGPAGYLSSQVSDDTGDDVVAEPTQDNVNAVGGQIGITHVKWGAVLNFHYFYEYSAKDRFQGESIGLNFAIKF